MKLQRLVGLALGTLSVWVVLAHPARAEGTAFSLTCGDATSAGVIVIGGKATVGGLSGSVSESFSISVTLSNKYPAATKCDIIAAIINQSNPFSELNHGISATAAGNVVTIQGNSPNLDHSVSINELGVSSDTTGEFTTISANLNTGDLVSLDQFFAPNLDLVPPPGTFFSGLFQYGSIGGTFFAIEPTTGGVSGPTILNALDTNFTGRFGIPFNDPILSGSQQIGWRTPFFDPTTVEIGWDGSTALDLANFGIEVAPAAAPEPATLALLGIGLAGLGFSRRKRK